MEARHARELGLSLGWGVLGLVWLTAASVDTLSFLSGDLWPLFIAVLAVFWVLGMALALSLFQSRAATALLILLPSFSVAALGSLTIGALIGAVFLAGLLYTARRTLVRDLNDRIVYRTYQVFAPGIKQLLLSVLIAVAALAWPALMAGIGSSGLYVSEELASTVVKPLAPAWQNFLPGVSADTTASEIIDRQIANQLGDKGSAAISETQRKILLGDLAQQLGLPQLSGNESFVQIVTSKINSFLQASSQRSPMAVSLILIIGALLTARVFIPIIGFLITILLMTLTIWILRQLGVLKITEESAAVQRLDLW